MDVFQTPEIEVNKKRKNRKFKVKYLIFLIIPVLSVILITIYFLKPKENRDILNGLNDSLVYHLKNLSGVDGKVELILRHLYGQINYLPDSVFYDASSVIYMEPPNKRDSCNYFTLKQKLLSKGIPKQILLSDRKFYKESNIVSWSYMILYDESNNDLIMAECNIDYIEKGNRIIVKSIELSLLKNKDNEIRQIEMPQDTSKKVQKKKEELITPDTSKKTIKNPKDVLQDEGTNKKKEESTDSEKEKRIDKKIEGVNNDKELINNDKDIKNQEEKNKKESKIKNEENK